MEAVVMKKVLTRVDVEHRLSFKTAGLQHFRFEDGVHHTDFQAVDATDGNIVRLRLIKRKQRYPKPVISKGWMAYVNQKGLRIGDRLIMQVIYNDDGEEAWFSIQAQRANVTFWGEPSWCDI